MIQSLTGLGLIWMLNSFIEIDLASPRYWFTVVGCALIGVVVGEFARLIRGSKSDVRDEVDAVVPE